MERKIIWTILIGIILFGAVFFILIDRLPQSSHSTTSQPSMQPTPTPQSVYVTATAPPTTTPTPTVALRQDPIIGVWRYSSVTGTGYDDRVRFNADGTFVESFSTTEQKTVVFCGEWSAQGGNSYATFTEPNRPKTFKYDGPSCGGVAPCIHDAEDKYPILYLTPYNGDVAGVCVPPTPVPVEGVAQIISEYSGWKSYGDFYVTGVVRNNVGRSVTVWVNVDSYDANDVKLGTGYDIVTVDPYGQSRFEAIVFGTKGSARGGTYRVYIDKIY